MKITGIIDTAAAVRQPEGDKQKLKEACRDFETIFLGHLMKSMRKTVSKSELFGSGREEEMFRDMLDDETCKIAAKTGSMGIADMLYKQLDNLMDKENQPQGSELKGIDR